MTEYSCYCVAFTAALGDLAMVLDTTWSPRFAAAVALGASHGYEARCNGSSGRRPATAAEVNKSIVDLLGQAGA